MKAMALGLALGCLLAATAGAAEWDAKVACGGVGSDERDALASRIQGANLSLEMFIAQGGEYVADVDVTLWPLDAKRSPLKLRTEGPICYLRVPSGRYRVEATFAGVTRSAPATIPVTAPRPVRVALGFPKSVGDRQTDAASPEEKQQAASKP
jgi:hypothetical protein